MKMFIVRFLMAVVAAISMGQLEAAEFFEGGISEGLGEAAAGAEKASLDAAAKTAAGDVGTVADQALKDFQEKYQWMKDANPDAYGNFEKTFTAALEDLGKNATEGFKVGEPFTPNVDSVAQAFEELKTTFGLKTEIPSSIKMGEITKDAIPQEPPAAEGNVGTDEANLGNQKATAERVYGEYTAAKNTWEELNKAQQSMINSKEALLQADPKADVADLDKDINAQQALIDAQKVKVDNFGVTGKAGGAVENVLAKAQDGVLNYAVKAKDAVVGKFSAAQKAVNEATSALKESRSSLKTATEELDAANADLKGKQTKLEAAKTEQKTLAEKEELSSKDNTRLSELNTEVESLTQEITDAQATIKEKAGALKNALDDIKAKTDALEKAQATAYESSYSTSLKAYEEQLTKVNKMKVEGTTEGLKDAEEELAALKQQALENGKFTERMKMKAKDFVKSKAAYLGETTIAGALFMVPGFIWSAYQDAENKKALIANLKTPQNFGGIWMVIPDDLINSNDPDNSIFLYQGFIPTASGACSVDSLSAGTQDCAVDTSKIDGSTQFFASVGASDFEGWGTQPITSSSFSGKMVHLNSGYVFYADGTPVNDQKPAVPLLSPAGAETKSMGAPATVKQYLDQLEGMFSGDIKVVTYNSAGFSVQTEEEESVAQEEGEQPSSEAIAAAIKTDQQMCALTDAAGDAFKVGNCAPILAANIALLNNGIAWPSTSTELNMWPLSMLSSQTAKDLGISEALPSLDDPMNPENLPAAYGIYAYTTTATALGKQLWEVSGGKVGDYVVALTSDNIIVPMMAPTIGTEYPFPVMGLNPAVDRLYSLLDGTITYADGTTATLNSGLITGQDIYKNIPGNLQDLIVSIQGWYPTMLKEAPVTVAGKKLYLASTTAGVPVYKLPASLENGGDDYLIAIDTVGLASGTKMLDLSGGLSSVKQFISLVSSRVYDATLAPWNTLAGHQDEEFSLVNCGDGALYGATLGSTTLSGCVPMSSSQTLMAPLYTLYMDADINPYNRPATMSFMMALQPTLGTAVASLIEGALESAGVTETMMQLAADRRSALEKLIIDDVEALASWSAFDTAKTNLVTKLTAKTATADDQAAYDAANEALIQEINSSTTLFAGLGDAFKAEYSDVSSGMVAAFNAVTAQLAASAPRVTSAPTSAAGYVAQGRLPISTQFIYSLVAGSITDNALKTAITSNHSAWKNTLTKDLMWAYFAEKGPFSFSPEGTVVPVMIEATTIDDLAQEVYIYTCPQLPGEYFLLGSSLADTAFGLKFDPLNKNATPYLFSITTGKAYTLNSSGGLIPAAGFTPKKITDTKNEPLDLLSARFPQLVTTSATYQAIQNSQSSLLIAMRQEEFKYSFNGYQLYIDSDDSANGFYIYQDITGIVGARTLSSSEILAQAKDFYAYGEINTSGSSGLTEYYWNYKVPSSNVMKVSLALDPSKARFVSLTTGFIYKPGTPTAIGRYTMQNDFDNLFAQITAQAKLNAGSVVAWRPALQQRISALVGSALSGQQAVKEVITQERTDELQAQNYPVLTVGDVEGIIAAPFVASPYPNLKLYNGKYYQVYQTSTSQFVDAMQQLQTVVSGINDTVVSLDDTTPESIVDFSVRNASDSQKYPELGILYEITYSGTTPTGVTVSGEMSGDVLDQARAAAGISVDSSGTQTLTIPNEQPGIDVSKITDYTDIPSVSGYQFKKLGLNYLLYITPTDTDAVGQKRSPYYLDLVSGIMFDTKGKPISIAGFYSQSSDGRVILMNKSSDGTVGTMLIEGTDGIVLEYVLKDTSSTTPLVSNPSTATSADGNYTVNTYLMTARWDDTINIQVAEYLPLAGASYYVEVTQGTTVYDVTAGTESVYFTDTPVRFDGAGSFRQMSYVMGAPQGTYLAQLDGYLLTKNDSSGNESVQGFVWQTTSSTDQVIDYVVYKPSGSSYTATYSWTGFNTDDKGTTTLGTLSGSATITIAEKTQTVPAGNIHYTQVGNYVFVDVLNIIPETTMASILGNLNLSVAYDYRKLPVVVQNLPGSRETLSASNVTAYTTDDNVKNMLGLGIGIKRVAGATDAQTRYLYVVGSAQAVYAGETSMAYYSQVGAGNLIDLESGIAYNASTGQPFAVVSASDLLTIRSLIAHIGVASVPQADGTVKKMLTYLA